MNPFNSEPVSREEYYAMKAASMTETQLQNGVIFLAQKLGWLVYHTHDSRRSQAGYPDLHLVHVRSGRSIFRELKTAKGRVSPDQQRWLDALTACGIDAQVWRPADWFSDRIHNELNPPPINKDRSTIPRNPPR
jgi:hypothetical protein